MHEVLNVLNGGPMLEGWNYTCMILIPKTKNLESMKDLRPISLLSWCQRTKGVARKGMQELNLT